MLALSLRHAEGTTNVPLRPGKMLYVGRMYNPITMYHARSMASKVSSMKPHHLKDLKAFIRFYKKHVLILRFKSCQ